MQFPEWRVDFESQRQSPKRVEVLQHIVHPRLLLCRLASDTSVDVICGIAITTTLKIGIWIPSTSVAYFMVHLPLQDFSYCCFNLSKRAKIHLSKVQKMFLQMPFGHSKILGLPWNKNSFPQWMGHEALTYVNDQCAVECLATPLSKATKWYQVPLSNSSNLNSLAQMTPVFLTGWAGCFSLLFIAQYFPPKSCNIESDSALLGVQAKAMSS